MGFITDHPLLVAFLAIGGFGAWKFIIQPILNQDQPLDPTEDQVEGKIKNFDYGKLNK